MTELHAHKRRRDKFRCVSLTCLTHNQQRGHSAEWWNRQESTHQGGLEVDAVVVVADPVAAKGQQVGTAQGTSGAQFSMRGVAVVHTSNTINIFSQPCPHTVSYLLPMKLLLTDSAQMPACCAQSACSLSVPCKLGASDINVTRAGCRCAASHIDEVCNVGGAAESACVRPTCQNSLSRPGCGSHPA